MMPAGLRRAGAGARHGPDDAVALERAAPNRPYVVVAVAERERAELAHEGIVLGVPVALVCAVPIGGPIVVRVGRARVAVDRRLAGSVRVAPARPPAAPPAAR